MAIKYNNMDGFTYHNIFETKGIEYLAIILFFTLLIPFWYILSKKPKFSKEISRKIGNLSAGVLRIPQGLFFSRNHTWTHLEKSGVARIGIDDLILHMTGEVKVTSIRKPGETINRGDLLSEIEHKGNTLRIYSPVSGEVMKSNTTLVSNAEVLNEDPYDQGWLCQVKPFKWVEETNTYYLADDATEWSKREIERVRRFLAASVTKYSADPQRIILQDGGEIKDHPLDELPDKVWIDFQNNFLNLTLI